MQHIKVLLQYHKEGILKAVVDCLPKADDEAVTQKNLIALVNTVRKVGQSEVSRVLRTLNQSGFLNTESVGNSIFYSLDYSFFDQLENLIKLNNLIDNRSPAVVIDMTKYDEEIEEIEELLRDHAHRFATELVDLIEIEAEDSNKDIETIFPWD